MSNDKIPGAYISESMLEAWLNALPIYALKQTIVQLNSSANPKLPEIIEVIGRVEAKLHQRLEELNQEIEKERQRLNEQSNSDRSHHSDS